MPGSNPFGLTSPSSYTSGQKGLPRRLSVDSGEEGLIPGLGRYPGGGNGILAWKIPRTEEPGRLQSVGSQRVTESL